MSSLCLEFEEPCAESVQFPSSGADFSDCGAYRFTLWRIWDNDAPFCLFVMLNPSTADAEKDDPTIRKCIGYAKRWGHGGLVVVNLFALRATDPKEMKRHPAPEGAANLLQILILARTAGRVVCAWGRDGKHMGRDARVVGHLRQHGIELSALKINGDGTPAHPLYLAGDLNPIPYEVQP